MPLIESLRDFGLAMTTRQQFATGPAQIVVRPMRHVRRQQPDRGDVVILDNPCHSQEPEDGSGHKARGVAHNPEAAG